MHKSIEEINTKIRNGSALVLTAGEMTGFVAEQGVREAAKRVDVVTTGTFGPMCSSGLLINTGHYSPRINFKEATLNGVPAYSGIAAVDLFIGATAQSEEQTYGGAHVIEDLVSGKTVFLDGKGHGSDCYPGRELKTAVSLATLNSAELTNFRNAYQNYNVAVNGSEKEIKTYLGVLKPNLANAGFSGSGEFSPLINDPYFRTIGTGTKIFLGGGVGWVTGPGTQHSSYPKRGANGVPVTGAGTLSVRGDLKGMNPRFLSGVWIRGYGVSLSVGLGIPIPVLDEEMARFTGVSDKEILAPVVDYSSDYPENCERILGHVSYKDLYSGEITVQGRTAQTFSLSSRRKGEEIAAELKKWILKSEFCLTCAAEVFQSV